MGQGRRSLGRRFAQGESQAVAEAGDGRRDERLTEDARGELVRIADDGFPFAHEVRALEEQRAACPRRPVERARQAVFGRWDVADAWRELAGPAAQVLSIGAVLLTLGSRNLEFRPRLREPALGVAYCRECLLPLSLRLEALVILARTRESLVGRCHLRLRIGARGGGRLLVSFAVGDQLRQLVEKCARRVSVPAQLVDVGLDALDISE